jgi:hypothetical protein
MYLCREWNKIRLFSIVAMTVVFPDSENLIPGTECVFCGVFEEFRGVLLGKCGFNRANPAGGSENTDLFVIKSTVGRACAHWALLNIIQGWGQTREVMLTAGVAMYC